MVQRGNIHQVTEVVKAEGGQLIRTETADFGILKGPAVAVGDALEIGSVCGDWCFLFLKGERVRANILKAPAGKEQEDVS